MRWEAGGKSLDGRAPLPFSWTPCHLPKSARGGAPSPFPAPGALRAAIGRATPGPQLQLQRHWLRVSASLYISPGALEWSCIKRASGVGAGGSRPARDQGSELEGGGRGGRGGSELRLSDAPRRRG